MALGTSFQPGQGGDNGYDRRSGVGGGSSPAQTPVQTAIKMLSLRLPTRVSPSQIAPQALLQGQGAAGAGGDPIANLINRILQASGTQPPPSPIQPQAAPARGGFTLPGERIPQPAAPVDTRSAMMPAPGGGHQAPQSQAPQPAGPQGSGGGWLGGLIDNGAVAGPSPMQPPPMRIPGTRVIPRHEAPDEGPPPAPDVPFDAGRGLFPMPPQQPQSQLGVFGQDAPLDVLQMLYGRKAGLFNQY